MKLCHTNFGFLKVMHALLLIVVWSILAFFIYMVKWVTYEIGTGKCVTKRKYNRIITITRYKIWLLNHCPNLLKFLGLYEPCKRAKDIFGHHNGL